MLNNVDTIRQMFRVLKNNDYRSDDGNYELINANFVADEPVIFGTLNEEYAQSELEWYKSQSLNVNDIPGKTPQIWKDVSDNDGLINSNYGWCIYSDENGNQYDNAIEHLTKSSTSRHATMIYNRPSMHKDAFVNGMHDFMCTFSTQLFIRANRLYYIVYMRSNDAIFGYKNDKYWHDYVHNCAFDDLKQTYPELEKGEMIWNAASLHVYPRHFDLII